ncbi:hypothetical protein HZC20_02255 [Candidatus Peregrinibacteria bacterium]|nr:hypothetical protein [Candidatus Peregrinibacteria bacterium]
MENPNILNIPAYQRKRSLAAKARSIGKHKQQKKSPARKTTKRRIIKPVEESIFGEIPVRESMPSQELFEEIPQTSGRKSGLREMRICGICEGYFDKINVAIIQVTSPIRKGDSLIFEKEGGLFEQTIDSIQIDRQDVQLARSGTTIGVKVLMKPQVGTSVYKEI